MKRVIRYLAAALIWASASTPSGLIAADRLRPNILLLMAEDIGNDLACYGTKGVKTPTIDGMAKDGTLYKRFYTNSPICSPSRTSLMMGMYQGSCGGHHHRSSVKGKEGLHYMTHYLREAGYTCIVGSKLLKIKTSKTDINVNTGDKLFDKAPPPPPGKPYFHQIQLQVTHRQAENPRWQDLRKSRGDLAVKTSEVEIPPYLPDTPEVRLDWATYLDQIEEADRHTKVIMDDLEERGVLDNTVVIWIGDNGRCQIRGKGYLYEDGIKCPLIIWGKGIEKGKVVNDLVAGIDLTATILAIAGIEKPDQMQGQAFLFNDNYKPNKYIYAARDRWDEVMDCSRTVVGSKYKYIYNFMPEVPYDAGQKYLDKDNVRPILPLLREMNKTGKLTPEQAYFFKSQKEVEQLFDLEADPFELNNLAASEAHQDIKREMNEAMFTWVETSGDKGLSKGADGKWTPAMEKKKNN